MPTKKITQSELVSAIRDGIEPYLNEISANKKAQLKHTAINAIDAVEDNIRTFCIFSAENPMAQKATNNFNRTANNSLNDYLKQGKFAWQPTSGKFGSPENTKIIFNISLDEVKCIGLKYKQYSFIFGRKEKDVTYFDYYQINKDKTDYDYIETKDYYENRLDADDYFTMIDKQHKFRIPFDVFKECCENFNKIINEQKEKSTKYRLNFDRTLNETLNENKTFKWRYENRCLLYGGLF